MWICPKCHTTVESSYEVCWSCGTTVDGVEDPTFTTADEAVPSRTESPRGGGKVSAASSASDAPLELKLVECYRPRDGIEAQFLIDLLATAGIRAVASGTSMGNTEYVLPLFAPRLEVREEDFTRARALVKAFEDRRRARREVNEHF